MKTASRRGVLRAGAAAALGAVPLLAACAGLGGSADSGGAKTLPPATVDYLWWGATGLVQEAESKLVAPFKEQHPGVNVNIITVAGGLFFAWVTTVLAGGQAPDALDDVANNARGLAVQRLVQPIDDLIKRDKVSAPKLRQELVAGKMQHEGKRYLLPYTLGGNPAVLYNRALFREAGVPEPPTDWRQAWSWGQWVDSMKRLTKLDADGQPQRYGVNRLGQGVYIPALWGGQWLSNDLKTVRCDSPEVIEAYRSWYEACARQNVAPVGETARLTELFGRVNFFLSQKIATVTSDTQSLRAIAEAPELDCAFMPMPRAKTATPEAYLTGVGLMPGSAKREQAWAWLRFLLEKDRYAELQGRPPVEPPAVEKWTAALFKGKPNVRASVFAAGIEQSAPKDPFWDHPRANEMNTEHFMPFFRRVMAGEVTAADELRRVKGPLQQLVNQQ